MKQRINNLFNNQFRNKNNRSLIIFMSVVLFFGVTYLYFLRSCNERYLEQEDHYTDLSKIIDRGVLRATTNFNSTNYFIYRGQPMGFHLELLKHFCEFLGVELELFVSNDLNENFSCLIKENHCDIIAMDLTVTQSRSKLFTFTEPHSQTRQVLVQRIPENNKQKSGTQINDVLIRSQLDLAGKTIHVQRNSAFVRRLENLMEEIGDTIYIVEVDKEIETLIEEVSKGEIDFTISDEHLAKVNEKYYYNIDIKTPISFYQNLAWALRNDSDELIHIVNHWIRSFTETNQYANIYRKYYENPRAVYIAKSPFNTFRGGSISNYDDYFKTFGDMKGWDWRLIASIAFQESRFDPYAVSWAGAFGIMQLMPGTAAMYNVSPESPVVDNIAAGIRYLNWIDSRLINHIEDDDERLKFVLASYNVGIGHVLDARRLAEKYGKDPNVWKDNVDYFVLNKSKPKYYLDPVVEFGYARGSEPYNYVHEILERYKHYKNILEKQEASL